MLAFREHRMVIRGTHPNHQVTGKARVFICRETFAERERSDGPAVLWTAP